MAFFNKILGLGFDDKKTVEVISTYDWRYGMVLFNGVDWGQFEKEYAVSYLRDHDIVSQMKKDSGLKEKDFVYLLVDWENVLQDFIEKGSGASVLQDYDANEYSTEEDIENFYNNLTPSLKNEVNLLLMKSGNIKVFSFEELR